MDFKLTENQELIRETARKFALDRVKPGALERDRSHAFPEDLLREMATMGLMGINIPADLGGAEAGVISYALAVMEIAAADPGVAVTMCVNNMVCEVIAQFGTKEQANQLIPKIQSGEWSSGAFCLSEPGYGSDAAGMKTTAVRNGDTWVLNGSKAWITSGAHAGIYIVWAKTEIDGADQPVITAFLVDPNSDGISIGKPEDKMGQHCSNTCTISFDQVQVPHHQILGSLGEGFKIAMMALDGGRIGIGSLATGIAREALELASTYALDRVQFGKPIAYHQAIQFKLADMATELDAAKLLVLRAAWLKQEGKRRFSKEASMAKLFASEAAGRISDEAIQIHGGYGYTKEYMVEKLYRDARVTRIYEGTSEIQRIVIGRAVLDSLK